MTDSESAFQAAVAKGMFRGLVSKPEDALPPEPPMCVSPSAVLTNGIGRRSVAHMNLTRTLADVWSVGTASEAMARAKARAAQGEAYRKAHGISKHDKYAARMPYAGMDRNEVKL